MFDLNFTVGPAKLFPGVQESYINALNDGWGEESHRSARFSEMSKDTISTLRKFFCIPESYQIFYTYSATESLELCSKMIPKNYISHISNGSFGNLWTEISEREGKTIEKIIPQKNSRNEVSLLSSSFPREMICITANETSTGIAYTPAEITSLRESYPDTFLAVDITSSMGAVEYNFAHADAWLFSVQKALGLPAGLGILILSPRAIQQATKNAPAGGHHNILKLKEKMDKKFQTPTTPNVLGIKVLGETIHQFIQEFGTIQNLYTQTQQKASMLYTFFEMNKDFSPAIKNPVARSESVIVIESNKEKIKEIYTLLLSQNIEVGKGYGENKDTQLRIGNFPVHTPQMIESLLEVFSYPLSKSV